MLFFFLPACSILKVLLAFFSAAVRAKKARVTGKCLHREEAHALPRTSRLQGQTSRFFLQMMSGQGDPAVGQRHAVVLMERGAHGLQRDWILSVASVHGDRVSAVAALPAHHRDMLRSAREAHEEGVDLTLEHDAGGEEPYASIEESRGGWYAKATVCALPSEVQRAADVKRQMGPAQLHLPDEYHCPELQHLRDEFHHPYKGGLAATLMSMRRAPWIFPPVVRAGPLAVCGSGGGALLLLETYVDARGARSDDGWPAERLLLSLLVVDGAQPVADHGDEKDRCTAVSAADCSGGVFSTCGEMRAQLPKCGVREIRQVKGRRNREPLYEVRLWHEELQACH